MKNFKTVVFAIMVLFAFGCTTNEEILNVESQNEENINSQIMNRVTLAGTNKIIVTYLPNSFFSRDVLRSNYGGVLGLIGYETCKSNPNTELWTIFNISEVDLTNTIIHIEADDEPSKNGELKRNYIDFDFSIYAILTWCN